MSAGDQPPDRPRWSITWLLRIQRTGRRRDRELDADGAKLERNHRVLLVLLIAVVGAETIILVLLDVLPLPR